MRLRISLGGVRGRITLSATVPWLVLLLGLLAYHQIYTVFRFDTPVHGDGEGYYAYLPAYLLDHDAGFGTLIRDHLIPAYAALGHKTPWELGFWPEPTGNWLDKYGVGESLLLLPFFAVGHAVASATRAGADGYTSAEVFAAGAAALVYTAAGLLVLRSVLRRHFPEWVTAVTLVAVTFGTSLFDFATWDSLVNHAFSFFVVALLLLATLRWYDRPQSWPRVLLIGALAGLLADIRLTNVVLLIALPLLGVGSVAAVRARSRLLWDGRWKVLAGTLAGAVAFLPQSITWYIATGHWLIRSYPGESFDFLHPHLIDSLFSMQPHGLLPYAPVLAFSFLGLGWAWLRRRDIALPVTAAFLPFWYIVSAWYDWSYQASFGQRAFIDILPLLALPFAYFLVSLPWRWLRVAAVSVAGVMVGATVILMIAYWQYRISGAGATWAEYVSVFRHPHLLFGPPQFPSWLYPR